MVSRRCLTCGRVFTVEGVAVSRCVDCHRALRNLRARSRRTAQQAVATSRVCAVCGKADDLTYDHDVPLSRGGDPNGPGRVLCRPCNSRRGNRD